MTSDAKPRRWPTILFATPVPDPSSSLVFANAELSLAPWELLFGISAVGTSTCLVCSARHGLPNCIAVSYLSA